MRCKSCGSNTFFTRDNDVYCNDCGAMIDNDKSLTEQLKAELKRNNEYIADAMVSLEIGDRQSEFYKKYKESGKCMYDFSMDWLRENE